jgi:monoamine oxidase/SAM-dependent methyltransferase
MSKVAIIGGGPGGLMTAWHIAKKCPTLVDLTLFEASDRLGGKILTKTFDDGAIETVPMDSEAVMIDRKIIEGVDGMRAQYGDVTADAILKFRAKMMHVMSTAQYYEGIGKHDNEHVWAYEDAEQLLNDEIDDPKARQFFQTMARSDIASELHNTNGLNTLKNMLMDCDGYIDVYSVVGGNERIIDGLKKSLKADVKFNTRVLKIDKVGAKYQVTALENGQHNCYEFDNVICCLPHNWLLTLQWGNETLRRGMVEHIQHFDRPAHYLRFVAEFDHAFWEGKVKGAWFMSEAFGGCCVYIEGARHDTKGKGVLNWLISGADVLAFANLNDAQLTDIALGTLPQEFGDAKKHLVAARSHRWLSSVNALPGGLPVRDALTNHIPEPAEHPGLFVVGDYLFDSTLNGLFDSADITSDLLVSNMMRQRYESGESRAAHPNLAVPSLKIDKAYFDNYRGQGKYADVWAQFTDVHYINDLFKLVWNEQPKRLLVTGSASGHSVKAFRDLGIDAHGLENNRSIYAKTPEEFKAFNHFGTILDTDFKTGEFDYVFDTALCHIAPRNTARAVSEIHRLASKGVFFGTVTADLTAAICDKYDLMRGIKKFGTWWEWSEIFFDHDFDLAVQEDDMLQKIWQRTLQAKKGKGDWYDDAESLKYCFYNRLVPQEG